MKVDRAERLPHMRSRSCSAASAQARASTSRFCNCSWLQKISAYEQASCTLFSSDGNDCSRAEQRWKETHVCKSHELVSGGEVKRGTETGRRAQYRFIAHTMVKFE